MVFINGKPQQIKLSECNNKGQIHIKPNTVEDSLFSNSLVALYSASQPDINECLPKMRQEAKEGKKVFGNIPLFCRSYPDNKHPFRPHIFHNDLSTASNLPACCLFENYWKPHVPSSVILSPRSSSRKSLQSTSSSYEVSSHTVTFLNFGAIAFHLTQRRVSQFFQIFAC